MHQRRVPVLKLLLGVSLNPSNKNPFSKNPVTPESDGVADQGLDPRWNQLPPLAMVTGIRGTGKPLRLITSTMVRLVSKYTCQ